MSVTSVQENRTGGETGDGEAARLRVLLLLAAGLAHEINNALGAALGFSEMALEELDQASPARPDLVEVLGALERSSQLMRQFLAVCRPAAGPAACVALNPLVKEASKQGCLEGAGGRLLLDVPGRLLMVRADPVDLFAAVKAMCAFAAAAAPGARLAMRLEEARRPPQPDLAGGRAGWACLILEGNPDPPPPSLETAWRRLGGGLSREGLESRGARLTAWLPLAEDPA